MSQKLITLDEISTGDFTGLLWPCRDGYRIVPGYDLMPMQGDPPPRPSAWIAANSRWLVGTPVMTSPGRMKLHRQFAKLAKKQHSTLAIASFARKYGFLHRGAKTYVVCPHAVPEGASVDEKLVTAELVNDWRPQIAETAAFVALWDIVKDPYRHQELARYIRWDSATDRLLIYFGYDAKSNRLTTNPSYFQDFCTPRWPGPEARPSEWDVIIDGRELSGQNLLETFPELRGPNPDLASAARLYLYRHINRRMSGEVAPALDMQREPWQAMVFYPLSLLGAIYLHFAFEVQSGHPGWQLCAKPDCFQRFPPKKNKRYCSENCRKLAWEPKRRANRAYTQHAD